MKRRRSDRASFRILSAAPLLVVGMLYGWASGAWAASGFIVGAIGASTILSVRATATPFAQRMAMAIAAGVGAFMGSLHRPDLGYGAGALSRTAASIAAAALLGATARLYVREKTPRYAITFAITLVALTACGTTRLGGAYFASTALFLVLALLAMRAEDPSRARWSDLGARQRASAIGVALVSIAVAVGLIRALPPIHDWSERRFESAFARQNVIGFSSTVALGQMKDMLRSDEVVLRLSGPGIDYLRGKVYDRYRPDGEWQSSRADRLRQIATPLERDARSPHLVEIQRLTGDASHYFLPMRARAVVTEAGSVLVDPTGTVTVSTAVRANRYSFEIGDRDDLRATDPTPTDLAVPAPLRPALERLAREWTPGAPNAEAQLEELAKHLRGGDYTYSLSYDREGDPLLDFLTVHKQGHCTYFASALALLGRALGVPTRLVAGYRVAERNPLTGQYLVRMENAHAWVEAYLPGAGWRTFDPTPPSEVVQNLPHDARLGVIASDLAAAVWNAMLDGAGKLTLTDILLALAAATGLLVLVRWLRTRAGRRGRALGDTAAGDGPLACFDRLTRALAHRGLERAPHESLDAFVARLEAAELAEAASLIARYAALRYGGIGDEPEIARDMDRYSSAFSSLS
jgi:transglutaminase-like putative cysteine protease